MPFIYLYLLLAFALAGLLGILLYRSAIWHLVDVIYYPLAAIGVALLFVSKATERNLLQIDEQLERNRVSLQAINTSKPIIDGTPTSELINSSFGLIAGIGELGEICRKVPGMDPTCSVAAKMSGAVDEFTRVANAKYESSELRIATACRAGETLIEKLRTSEHMSSLVGDELAWQLKDAKTREHHYLNYGAIEREARAFEVRARARLDSLRNAISDNSEPMKFVFMVNEEEIKASKTIIQALYPCLSMPQASLDKLASWSGSRQSQEAALAQLEAERKRVQGTPAISRTVLWMQLNLWPLILIAALSLKFSKGIAGLRKYRADSEWAPQTSELLPSANMPPLVSEPDSGHPNPESEPAASVAKKDAT